MANGKEENLQIDFAQLTDLYVGSYTQWSEAHSLDATTLVSLAMMTVGFIERMKNHAVIRENGKKSIALALLRFIITDGRIVVVEAAEQQILLHLLDMVVPALIDGLVSAANGELWSHCSLLPACLVTACNKIRHNRP
jgi:hypothetical protein